MARNGRPSAERRPRWAGWGLALASGALLAYAATWPAPPPRTEVATRASDRARDPSAWLELYRQLDAQPPTPRTRNSPTPSVRAPQALRPEPVDAQLEDDDAELHPEDMVDPEEARRPLGGMSLEMIPPSTAPLTERTEATQALYNDGDDLAAREAALVLLEEDPANLGLIRIVASTACMDGLTELARAHYAQLPGSERRDMRMHCLRHGTVVDELAEAEDKAALDDFLDERSEDWDPARTGPPTPLDEFLSR